MRTLVKPPKQKPSTSQPKKQAPGKKEVKQSKKVVKTMFHSPFRYKIQALSHEDGDQVVDVLVNFAKVMRGQLMIPERKVIKQKVIRFESKTAYQKPPLICKNLIFGLKKCTSLVKTALSSLIIIFYDESMHAKFEQLMCNIIFYKKPYIVLRQDKKLSDELGIKNLLALGAVHEELEGLLLKFASRCLIEIPWLVDPSWIPLDKTVEKRAQRKGGKKGGEEAK